MKTGESAVDSIRSCFSERKSLDEQTHAKIHDLFKKFLLVGGLPDAVNAYLETKNISEVREIQSQIHDYYATDASKYDVDNKLKIRRIYDMVISSLENKGYVRKFD